MYANAYKCNACGSISRSGGTHCNANMVPVVVMDNLFADAREGSPPSPTVIIREVVIDKTHDKPWLDMK